MPVRSRDFTNSVAMGSAPEAVKGEASLVVKSAKEDGWAEAMRLFLATKTGAMPSTPGSVTPARESVMAQNHVMQSTEDVMVASVQDVVVV